MDFFRCALRLIIPIFLGCQLVNSQESGYDAQYAGYDCVSNEFTANSTSQALLSPGFPGPYSQGAHCEWTISLPSSRAYSSYVKLVFETVNFNGEGDCGTDYILVLTSDVDEQGVKICSSGYSPHSFVLSAENNNLRVIFNGGQRTNSSFRLLFIEEKVESSIFWTERSESQSKIQRLSLNFDGVPEDYSVEEVLGYDGTGFQGIATDYKQKMVCWTDQVTSRGFGCTDTGRNHTVSVGMGWETSSQSEGLAIDWISKNFYLVDGFYNSIKIGNFNFTNEVVFALIERGLSKPRAIAVHPLRRYLFWTDVGAEPKIERSNLAGEHRRVIVSSGLTSPNGITVDVKGQKIYWTDVGGEFSSLESANLDGTYRRTLYKRPASEASFFDVTLFKNLIFVTDTLRSAVLVIEKAGKGSYRETLSLDTSSPPYGITTDDKWAQPFRKNPCLSNPCSHICVGHNSEKKYKCVCPKGFAVPEDGHTCILKYVPKSSLIMSTMSKICFLPPTFPHERFLPLAPSNLCFIDDVPLITSITADVDDNLLFYANASSKTINSLSLSSDKNGDVVVELTQFAEAIAVDWIFNNLYWVDSEVGALYVTDYHGEHKVLLFSDIGVPKDIVVDPVERFLFWSGVHDYPYIERSDLDGNFRTELVVDDLQEPGGMVLHLLEKKLYFSDKKRGTIESINYDGTDRQVVYTNPKGAEFYKMAIYQDYLVWTEIDVGFLVLNLKTKALVRSVVTLDISLGLVMYSDAVQPYGQDSCTRDSAYCEQIALPSNTKSGWICKCSFGFQLANDGVSCVSEQVNNTVPFVLVSDASWRGVFQVDLDTPRYGPNLVIDLREIHEGPSAVAFDDVESAVYYGFASSGKIYKKSLEDDMRGNELIKSDVHNISSLIIDSNRRTYFWTDGTGIYTALLSGYKTQTLISERTGISSFAIHPEKGKLYWFEGEGYTSLWSANMDGTNKEQSDLDVEEASNPSGLTIDYESGKLFWCDPVKHTIETLDGSNHQVLLQLNETSKPFDLLISEDHVYWLDWAHKSVQRANKNSGEDIVAVVQNLASPTDFYIHNSNDNIPEHSLCSEENYGCAEFCLPDGHDAAHCFCGDGVLLKNNRKDCEDDLEFKHSPTLNPEIAIGDDFKILCDTGNEHAVVTWYKNDVNITGEEMDGVIIDRQLSTLFVASAKKEQAGCYKCVVSLPNNASIERGKTLYFGDEDFFCKKPEDKKLDINDTHVMHCSVQKDGYTYTWEKDGQQLVDSDNVVKLNETAIMINNVGFDDVGEYTCRALPKPGNQQNQRPRAVSAEIKIKRWPFPSGRLPFLDCGLANGPEPLDVAGVRDAHNRSNPWVARIAANGRNLVCTGSLIKKNWVITAAHCLTEEAPGAQPSDLSVKIGTHDNPPTFNVLNIIYHDNFTSQGKFYQNDLVLLKLDPVVELSRYTIPICLPDNYPPLANETLRNSLGKIAFFKGGRSKQPSEKFTTIVAKRQCGTVQYQYLKDKLFCSEFQSARNCMQNRGAGFAVQRQRLWFLTGVMSSISECTTDNPKVFYTKVHPYLKWIYDMMLENSD